MYDSYMSPLKNVVARVSAEEVYRLELENHPVIDSRIKVNTYVCDKCSRLYYPDELYSKQIHFVPMQPGTTRARSRALATLCIECAQVEPEWKLPGNRRANRVIFKPEGYNG